MNMSGSTPTIPDGYIIWEDLQAKVAASRTPEQQQAYKDSAAEADAQIALAELVYAMRTQTVAGEV